LLGTHGSTEPRHAAADIQSRCLSMNSNDSATGAIVARLRRHIRRVAALAGPADGAAVGRLRLLDSGATGLDTERARPGTVLGAGGVSVGHRRLRLAVLLGRVHELALTAAQA
jgi:hypothetical protein